MYNWDIDPNLLGSCSASQTSTPKNTTPCRPMFLATRDPRPVTPFLDPVDLGS